MQKKQQSTETKK